MPMSDSLGASVFGMVQLAALATSVLLVYASVGRPGLTEGMFGVVLMLFATIRSPNERPADRPPPAWLSLLVLAGTRALSGGGGHGAAREGA
jgi:hypothetical protein